METKVQPITNKYWIEDVFPLELLSAVKALNIGGLGVLGRGESLGSKLNCKLASSLNRFFRLAARCTSVGLISPSSKAIVEATP
jgi:hypothetical protein